MDLKKFSKNQKNNHFLTKHFAGLDESFKSIDSHEKLSDNKLDFKVKFQILYKFKFINI